MGIITMMIWIGVSQLYEFDLVIDLRKIREIYEKNNNKIIADLKNLNNEKNQSMNLAHLSRQIFSFNLIFIDCDISS